VRRISGKEKMEKVPLAGPNSSAKLKTAVLVDVDGTLAGPYRAGRRKLRPTALSAIKMLSEHAPVFLWSISGADNGKRLLFEFPKLGQFISGCYGKFDYPLEMVERLYCIDDEPTDPQAFVLRCNYVIVDTYNGGSDSGLLLEAAEVIVQHILKTGL